MKVQWKIGRERRSTAHIYFRSWNTLRYAKQKLSKQIGSDTYSKN